MLCNARIHSLFTSCCMVHVCFLSYYVQSLWRWARHGWSGGRGDFHVLARGNELSVSLLVCEGIGRAAGTGPAHSSQILLLRPLPPAGLLQQAHLYKEEGSSYFCTFICKTHHMIFKLLILALSVWVGWRSVLRKRTATTGIVHTTVTRRMTSHTLFWFKVLRAVPRTK